MEKKPVSTRRNGLTAKPKTNRFPNQVDHKERALVRALDDLAEFEEFEVEILPMLKKMIRSKASTPEILEQARPLLVAKLVSIAMNSDDEGRRASMALSLLDRIDGKPVERKEFHHKLGKLKDEEVDALILTKLREANEDEVK
jgi:hypothetical protein